MAAPRAIRLVVGADDDRSGIIEPAERLERALRRSYDDPARIDLTEVAGLGHALADEPGMDPAPQSASAAEVDRLSVEWLRRFLIAVTDSGGSAA